MNCSDTFYAKTPYYGASQNYSFYCMKEMTLFATQKNETSGYICPKPKTKLKDICIGAPQYATKNKNFT